jgi:hypothetical protein
MNLKEIAEMPTVVANVHESCYRASALLQEMLTAGVPGLIVVRLINEIEDAGNQWAFDREHRVDSADDIPNPAAQKKMAAGIERARNGDVIGW